MLLFGAMGYAQRPGEEILKRVEGSMSAVQDYSVTLDVTADIERLKVPPMHTRMYFKQPDKFHFESDGFALLPREGLAFSVSKLLSRFSVTELSSASSGDKKAVELTLRPNNEMAKARKVVVAVDTVQWKPTRVVTTFFDGRTIAAALTYETHGGFMMPSLLSVELGSPPADTTLAEDELSNLQRMQMPRKGTITVRYSDYKINMGLPDDIFRKE